MHEKEWGKAVECGREVMKISNYMYSAVQRLYRQYTTSGMRGTSI